MPSIFVVVIVVLAIALITESFFPENLEVTLFSLGVGVLMLFIFWVGNFIANFYSRCVPNGYIKDYKSFSENCLKTEGIITSVKEHVFAPNAPKYTAARNVEIEFKYKDLSNNEYVVCEKSTQPLEGGSHKVGDVIEVKYDQRNPSIAYSTYAIGLHLFLEMR